MNHYLWILFNTKVTSNVESRKYWKVIGKINTWVKRHIHLNNLLSDSNKVLVTCHLRVICVVFVCVTTFHRNGVSPCWPSERPGHDQAFQRPAAGETPQADPHPVRHGGLQGQGGAAERERERGQKTRQDDDGGNHHGGLAHRLISRTASQNISFHVYLNNLSLFYTINWSKKEIKTF